jgi:hypothetical protein
MPQFLLVKEILQQILISNSSVRLAVGGQLLGKHADPNHLRIPLW